MEFNDLEALTKTVAGDPNVIALTLEIEAIIAGKEPRLKLLALLPIIAKIAYSIADKDGTKGAAVESIVEIMVNLLEKNIENK